MTVEAAPASFAWPSAQKLSSVCAMAKGGGATKGAPGSPASAALTPARFTHIASSISVVSSASAGSSVCPVQAIISEDGKGHGRSEEHTSELKSLMRISYAVFCLKKKI